MRIHSRRPLLRPVLAAVGGLVLVTLVSSGGWMLLAADSTSDKRGNEMTQQEIVVQTKEVDAFGGPEQQDDVHATNTDGVPHRLASLEEIREQLGVLLVPSHLPDGFARTESFVHIGRSAHLSYTSENGDLLMILQDTMPASLQVKAGSVSRAQIGTGQGELIRGGWHQVFKDGKASSLEWDSDVVTTLLFEKDGRWIVLMAMGADSISSEAELIRIAESLAPY